MITTAPAPADAGSTPDSPPRGDAGIVAWYAEGFSDLLGDRLRLFDNAGPALELLRFNPRVAHLQGFEAAVRARVEALASFSHPAFAKVRTLTVLDDPQPQLALVSELVAGERLSTLLRTADARGARFDPTCAIWLLRQLLPALAAFHEATGGAPHRLLDADRVLITQTGEVAIAEYVFGGLSDELLPTIPTTDIGQAALLAIAILRGRAVRADEHYGTFERLVQQACALSPSADVLRPWLRRALSKGPDRFKSAREAYHALDELLPGVWGSWPDPRSLPEVSTSVALIPAPTLAVGRPTFWQRALPAAPAPSDSVARRLWRVNWALTAVVLTEAACIAFLIVQSVTWGAPGPPLMSPPRSTGVAPVTLAGTIPMLPLPTDVPDYDGALPADFAALPAGVVGWLVVDSKAPVKVYANGRLLGVATRRRFRVPAGEHTITLINGGLNARYSVSVRIGAGRSVLVMPPQDQP